MKGRLSGKIRRRSAAGRARGPQDLRLVPPQAAVRQRFRLPAGGDGSDGEVAASHQRPSGGMPWTRLVVLAALVYFAVTFIAQEGQFNALRQEIYQLQGEIALRQAEVEALRERRDYLSSPAYVEAEARRRFNLTRPGEIHYLTVWEEDGEEAQAAGQDEEEDWPAEDLQGDAGR